MAGKDVCISVKTFKGRWEFIGTDRARGVYAENLQLSADIWGSSGGSFDLKRNTYAQWPDIGAFAACDVEIGGVKVWSGRVKGTPTRDGADTSINVQLEGWQAHLDDDAYVPFYVATKMSDWKDARGTPYANLNGLSAAPQITAGDTGITILFPSGSATQGRGAVIFDAGPGKTVQRMVIDAIVTPWGGGNRGFGVGYGLTSDAIAHTGTTLHSATTGAGPTTWGYTVPSQSPAPRYFSIWYDANSHTAANDEGVQITGVRMFVSTTYESLAQSTLKASTVINDAITSGTTLLSPDKSQIQATSFSIPDLHSFDYKTPREVISGANAYHNYVTKVDTEKRMVFRPQPASPEIEVGQFSALDFQDASQGSGDDIYNRVIVEGTSASGQLLSVKRYQSQLAAGAFIPSSFPNVSVSNPSFDVNTASWQDLFATISRTTTAGEFDTAPGGLKVVTGGGSSWIIVPTSGIQIIRGATYRLIFRARLSSGTQSGFTVSFGASNDFVQPKYTFTSAFQTFITYWTPETNAAASFDVELVSPFSVSANIFYDSFSIEICNPSTVPGTLGFTRTKILQVDTGLPDDGFAAGQIGLSFLAGHQTTPFRGQVQLTGPARNILDGHSVPPEQMLLKTTDMIRLNHLIDPTTGAVGRDGRIVNVTYNYANDSASIDLDSTSSNFEALLSRFGSVTGN